eukprot:2306131-Amphidinium_carterae.1
MSVELCCGQYTAVCIKLSPVECNIGCMTQCHGMHGTDDIANSMSGACVEKTPQKMLLHFLAVPAAVLLSMHAQIRALA